MAQIQLSKGKFALVDDEDFDWLNQWKWCVNAAGYAIRGTGQKKNRKIIFMHKQIMDFPESKVDHKNQDKLDNQRGNLRTCTHRQNIMNAGLRSNNTTGYKGVVFDKARGKWHAQIRDNYKIIHIGRFSSPEDAALAYNFVAYHLYGDFAYLNGAAA